MTKLRLHTSDIPFYTHTNLHNSKSSPNPGISQRITQLS